MSLPPRPPTLPTPMYLLFDVDCGDALLPGHVVIARGLADQGRSADDLTSGDQSLHDACQMVDLVYEIVPGVPPSGPSAPSRVDATYDADVALRWSTGGSGPDGLGGPGWFENYRGGPSTVGGLGPWPVPEGARRLTFWLQAAGTGACHGAVRVDLQTGTARWEPADPEPGAGSSRGAEA